MIDNNEQWEYELDSWAAVQRANDRLTYLSGECGLDEDSIQYSDALHVYWAAKSKWQEDVYLERIRRRPKPDHEIFMEGLKNL